MLPPDELIDALKQGQGAADCCGHWCRAGAAIDDGRYRLHHNGLSGRDTDSAVIHGVGVLALPKDALAAKIKTWIVGLHKGEKVDLNAALATGGPITTDCPYLVGERGLELFVTESSGPAMTIWPLHPTQGDAQCTD